MSRRLLTTSTATISSPIGTAAANANPSSDRVWANAVPTTATRPKKKKTKTPPTRRAPVGGGPAGVGPGGDDAGRADGDQPPARQRRQPQPRHRGDAERERGG